MDKETIAQIDDRVYLGSCLSVSPEILKMHNIRHIFHIGFDIPTPIVNSEYFVAHCDHEYFDLDDDLQSANKMLQIGNCIVSKINELHRHHTGNILVCCVAGKSRSASVIALFLHQKYPELSFGEIISRIHQCRSISINKAFEKALKSYIDKND